MILQKWQFFAEMTQLHWKKYFSKVFLFLKSQIVKIHHQKEKKKELLLCYGKEGTVCISLLMCTT